MEGKAGLVRVADSRAAGLLRTSCRGDAFFAKIVVPVFWYLWTVWLHFLFQLLPMNIRTLISAFSCLAASLSFTQAQVTVMPGADVAGIVATVAKVTKLSGDLKFTEGPVWVPSKKALIFSDIPAAKLMQWTEAGGVKPYRDSENANGNTLDASGNLVSCQHTGRNLVAEDKEGKVSVVVGTHEGKKFSSPNDLVIKSDGAIYFTDPHYGLPKGQPKETEGNFVYRLSPDRKTTTIVSKEFDMPNGVAFSPDEKKLYIADSGKGKRVVAFPVKEDGSLGEALYSMTGGADGIRCDEKGNLYTSAGDGVRIYDPTGKQLALIAFPEVPANCAFGGDDFKTLFVTARTGLYSVPLLVAGDKLKPAAKK
jgi:gluconolactonase